MKVLLDDLKVLNITQLVDFHYFSTFQLSCRDAIKGCNVRAKKHQLLNHHSKWLRKVFVEFCSSENLLFHNAENCSKVVVSKLYSGEQDIMKHFI